MITKYFILLLLLYDGKGGYSEGYIGKITDCLHAREIIEKKIKKDKIINKAGYVCTSPQNYIISNRYLKKLTPMEKKFVDDVQEKLPSPHARPSLIKKRKVNGDSLYEIIENDR